MNRPRILIVLSLAGLHACASADLAPSVALQNTSALTQIPAAEPPPGFLDFCRRASDQCEVHAAGPTPPPFAFDARILETLKLVNAAINDAIAPKSDSLHYGRQEYWTIPSDRLGDCDDYVVTKRTALIA